MRNLFSTKAGVPEEEKKYNESEVVQRLDEE